MGQADLHTRHQIFKVYIKALTGFSEAHCPDDLNTTLLSQGCVLETAPRVDMGGRKFMPRPKKQGGISDWPVPAQGSKGKPCACNDLFQQKDKKRKIV